ncbi:MAG: NUDIX hydrolase [Acidimicrobiales bacterium]
MREWVVAGGLVESADGLLLVQNRRRDGSLDWSPPGGVIEAPESVLDGLTREVLEETGILVDSWDGPVYRVETMADELGWRLRVEVHLARSFSGRLRLNDPDGIVVDARFVPRAKCGDHLAEGRVWVREPLGAWLADPWAGERSYRYRIEDSSRVVRL